MSTAEEEQQGTCYSSWALCWYCYRCLFRTGNSFLIRKGNDWQPQSVIAALPGAVFPITTSNNYIKRIFGLGVWGCGTEFMNISCKSNRHLNQHIVAYSYSPSTQEVEADESRFSWNFYVYVCMCLYICTYVCLMVWMQMALVGLYVWLFSHQLIYPVDIWFGKY